MSETPLYQVKEVKKHFPVVGGVLRRTKGHVKALDGVDLSIFRGETISIIGESGCGKTTLGRMMALLDKPTEGALEFDFGQCQQAHHLRSRPKPMPPPIQGSHCLQPRWCQLAGFD